MRSADRTARRCLPNFPGGEQTQTVFRSKGYCVWQDCLLGWLAAAFPAVVAESSRYSTGKGVVTSIYVCERFPREILKQLVRIAKAVRKVKCSMQTRVLAALYNDLQVPVQLCALLFSRAPIEEHAVFQDFNWQICLTDISWAVEDQRTWCCVLEYSPHSKTSSF